VTKSKTRPHPPALLDLMACKTAILMKARAFADMGMEQTAQPMWAAAAGYEAAASRISAASCYQKGGELSRAANLYQAALAAPLGANTGRDVRAMLAVCLEELSRTAVNGSPQAGDMLLARSGL
jgi:hypothetical protein